MRELYHWLGASADADQALAVPVEPVARLAPSGFDPSRWRGRMVIRCMGGRMCSHLPGICTADPEYQRFCAWLRAQKSPTEWR